jgi:hypothetical protein
LITDATKTPSAGQRLADELLTCDALIGLTRAEVRDLIGRDRTRFREYGTGPQRVMPIDSELLDITFVAGSRQRPAGFAVSEPSYFAQNPPRFATALPI